jgi:hypothetical protein
MRPVGFLNGSEPDPKLVAEIMAAWEANKHHWAAWPEFGPQFNVALPPEMPDLGPSTIVMPPEYSFRTLTFRKTSVSLAGVPHSAVLCGDVIVELIR